MSWVGRGRPLGWPELRQWQWDGAGSGVVNTGLGRAGCGCRHTSALTLCQRGPLPGLWQSSSLGLVNATYLLFAPKMCFPQDAPLPRSLVRTEPPSRVCVHTPCSSAAFCFALPCDLKSFSPSCMWPFQTLFFFKECWATLASVFKTEHLQKGGCGCSSFLEI